jgi:ABC-type phosphate transport system substrate-binding protein
MRARRFIVSIVALLTAASAAALSVRADPQRPGYQIVCNPNNPATAVDRQFVQDAFLKKIRAWPTGDGTRPVDLAPTSPVRRHFSQEVLRRPVEAVRIFWQQRIFSGRDLPPPEVGNDAEVIKFVLRDRGAIGYVSAGAALNGAKVLSLR